MRKLLLGCLLCLVGGLHAERLAVDPSNAAPLLPGIQALAGQLSHGNFMALSFGEESDIRDASGAWRAPALGHALSSVQDFSQGIPNSGAWLARQSLPRILLVENSSTVSPMSKKLVSWRLPFEIADFEGFEAHPEQWLGSSDRDLVIFSSPGWWDGFSNPPSGPSRMKEMVANAVRHFVHAGGSVCFVDLAQWDLERCWPHSVDLNSLGPYQLNRFEGMGAQGKLALAPEGVAADKLFSKSAFPLFEQPNFPFPDGSVASAYAAYAFPDPQGGPGIVMGLAFHVLDQDDSLAAYAQRLFLNLAFISGAVHLRDSRSASAAVLIPSPQPRPARNTATLSPTATALPPTPRPTDSPVPTLPPLPSPTSTLSPRPMPTVLPTPIPSPTALPPTTPLPTLPPAPSAPLLAAIPEIPTFSPPTAVATLAPAPQVLIPSPETATPQPMPTRVPAPMEAPKIEIPTPFPAKTRLPTAVVSTHPAPSPIAQATMSWETPHIHDAIGCLQSAPEPFDEGGVYVYYCLKHPASVRLRVYDDKGHLVFSGRPEFHLIGNHQEYYAGIDQGGVPLDQGHYWYKLEAVYDNHSAEWRQSEFNLKHKKH